MALQLNYITEIAEGIRTYLAPFKHAGQSIPVYIHGFTKEMENPKYPHFYIKSFALMKDTARLHGDRKYEYLVDRDAGTAVKRHRRLPYLVRFRLEFVELNPINFYQVQTLMTMKYERDRCLRIIRPDASMVDLPMEIQEPIVNPLSEVLHCFWQCDVHVLLPLDVVDPVDAEIVTQIDLEFSKEGL